MTTTSTERRMLLMIAAVVPLLCGAGCKKPEAAPPAEAINPLKASDMPVLDILPGHEWRYQVTVDNPKDIRSGTPVTAGFSRIRRYLGRIDPGSGHPASDCFEIRVEGRPVKREYTTIAPDEVAIIGEAKVGADGQQTDLVWLQQPIPFFKAGLTAGDSIPLAVLSNTEKLWRVTRVIGREKITVPAGEFDTVRLQTFGKDGKVSLRKTYWYAPGKGIIREEKSREVEGSAILTETEELAEVTPGIRP